MASATKPRHILLTGVPGVGKTTLINKVCQELLNQGHRCQGFITEEVRSGGRRIGFDVTTLDGQRGQLARVSDSASTAPVTRKEYRVGQYSVNLSSFEQVAIPTLQQPKVSSSNSPLIFVIDEIGKMEIFSQTFVQAMRKLLYQTSMTVVATIPVPKGKPISLVEELRNGQNSLVFEVTRQNREDLCATVLSAVCSTLNDKGR